MVFLDSAFFLLQRPPLGGVLAQHTLARVTSDLVVLLVAPFRAEPFRPMLARLGVDDWLARTCLLLPLRLVDLVGRRRSQRLRSRGAFGRLRLGPG